ncbi:hypothetical protein [Agarivorans sp. Alg241-V36]|uniref:hypothetical protein n=1 Tax=Agarivorans sp. Alg241-V36 TaxID=2305992 RepID=UPI00351AC008
MSTAASLDSVLDREVLPKRLNPPRRKIGKVSAYGAYDANSCYTALKGKGVIPVSSPRKNAVYWEIGPKHNQAVKALKNEQLEE